MTRSTLSPTALRRQQSATLADGGATFDSRGVSLNVAHGFMVGGWGGHEFVVPVSEFTTEWLDAHAMTLFGLGAPWVGTWVHEDHVYVDGSQWFIHRDDAVAVARERNQLAVYDVATGESIYVQ